MTDENKVQRCTGVLCSGHEFNWYLLTAYSVPGFPDGSGGKETACNAGDAASIPGLERHLGEGDGNTLQYSCLENSMDRGALQAMVQEVTESDTTEVTQHARMQGSQRGCLTPPAVYKFPNKRNWILEPVYPAQYQLDCRGHLCTCPC